MAQVLEYLRCNTWPPDESSYSNVFEEQSPQIVLYDNEINRLAERLDKLRTERHQVASYVDACRALFAPVRRLPNELLEAIFDMCAPPSSHRLSDNDTGSEELARLSKRHLLQLSKVCSTLLSSPFSDTSRKICSRWHTVALETPGLWTQIVVDTPLWINIDGVSPQTCLKLFEQMLKRSGTFPLTFEFSNKERLSPGASNAQKLLIQHAGRWKSAYIEAPVQTLRSLGNLPLLETLHIVDEKDGDGSAVTFGPAPRLKCFKFHGNASNYPKLPWHQLEIVTIRAAPTIPVHVSSAISLINHMPPACELELELLELSVELPITIPSAVSDMAALSLLLSGKTQDYDTRGILAAIFDALTLRNLQFLEFHRVWYGSGTALWPSDAFSAFAQRSSLGDCLIELQIYVRITDAQLVECLALLPSLEALIISDCTGEPENVLITDTLLRALTLKGDSESDTEDTTSRLLPAVQQLIPALHFFRMSSLFRFTEDVYWEMLESRLESGRMDDVPF
ncbi:hypothetical protein FB45DRAFT_1020310 [Roridomyces roridus]|uniref:F-box domain-containing protein n=1 Tax=Roridomyces roridus TaxID=1738132 RepID=A0AAD7CGQ5_9AGAR|nr:hypothetical protein FB45DRAFT_1020310 [Roridomyces roridus]